MIDQQWITNTFLFIAIGTAIINSFFVKGGIILGVEKRKYESKWGKFNILY